jgi:hypothetical protein
MNGLGYWLVQRGCLNKGHSDIALPLRRNEHRQSSRVRGEIGNVLFVEKLRVNTTVHRICNALIGRLTPWWNLCRSFVENVLPARDFVLQALRTSQ